MLVLALVLGAAREVAGGPLAWLAWLEELSGPGPFEGIHVAGPPLFCLVEITDGDHVTRRWAWSWEVIEGTHGTACVTVPRRNVRPLIHVSPEATWYRGVRNDLAPSGHAEDDHYEVSERVVGLIAYYKPARGVDLGVGATYHRFGGDGALGEFGFGRGALSLRARVRPLTWIPAWHESRPAAAIGLYSGIDQMRGSFSAADFRSTIPFRSRNDTRQMKIHVLVDLYALLR